MAKTFKIDITIVIVVEGFQFKSKYICTYLKFVISMAFGKKTTQTANNSKSITCISTTPIKKPKQNLKTCCPCQNYANRQHLKYLD